MSVDFYNTAALLAMQNAVLATPIPSVCPSHAGTLCKRMKMASRGLHCEVAKTLFFWYQQWLGATFPFTWIFLCSKWPTPCKKCRLRPISANNVSTIGVSEKSSIIANRKSTTRFPASDRRSAYVTPKSPKGWLKKWFCHFCEYKSI